MIKEKRMGMLKTWAAAAAMVAVTGVAQASLVLQANGMEVLDTNSKLLWLHDWNSSGLKIWADATTWAAGLTVGGATAGDWRLPEIGEYADLWADPDIGSSLSGLQSKFIDVQSLAYWSGTEYAPNTFSAWRFLTADGDQVPGGKDRALYAVAVRPGDGAASVPEPQTLALALLALGATVGVRRRRSRESEHRELSPEGLLLLVH
jgi:MYXO-CTERM domain-containing protein